MCWQRSEATTVLVMSCDEMQSFNVKIARCANICKMTIMMSIADSHVQENRLFKCDIFCKHVTYFVCKKNAWNTASIRQRNLWIQIFFPPFNGFKSRWSCDVKNDEASNSFLVVNSCHVTKPLLTCTQQHLLTARLTPQYTLGTKND